MSEVEAIGFQVTIDVTDRDIFDGLPMDCARCPVALALTRSLELVGREAPLVDVDGWWLQVELDGKRYAARCPNQLRDFIWAFDRRGTKDLAVEPFQWTLWFYPA